MRALLAILLLSSTALAQGVVQTDATKWHWGDRFSHAGHSLKMQSKGKAEPFCKSCHQLRGDDFRPIAPGKNDHHPCIDCHGPAEFTRGPKCLTCHSNVRGFKPGKPWFPPYLSPGEFHISFPHAKHVGMNGQASNNCGGCHAAQEGNAAASGASGKSHQACGVCHARDVRPDMNDCAACHQAGPAPTVAQPANQPSPFRVTAKFDHLAHANKVKARGMQPSCASCHVGLSAQDPPGRPTMQACEGCHDGKTSFDARGTQCGRCHTAPAEMKLQPMPQPPTVFRHQAHQQNGVNVNNCTDCHGVGIDWQSVQAGRNQHQPCQKCHAAEFRLPNQPICLSCHERNDPFQPNPLRPPSEERRGEWRLGELPHPPHLAGGIACATCHAQQAGTTAQKQGHQLCGQCHQPPSPTGAVAGARTSLAQCGACHVLASAPRQARTTRPWSTRDRFAHDDRHRSESCDGCHRAPGVADVVNPSMQLCADKCHDGTKAFKVTGFECARCHAKAVAK